MALEEEVVVADAPDAQATPAPTEAPVEPEPFVLSDEDEPVAEPAPEVKAREEAEATAPEVPVEPAAEEVTPAPAEEEAAGPDVDPALLARAEELGIGETEAQPLKDAGVLGPVLEAAARAFDARVAEFGQKALDAMTPAEAVAAPPAAKSAVPAADEGLKTEWDEDLIGPEVSEVLKTMQRQHAAELASVTQRLDATLKDISDAANATQIAGFDKMVDGLGEEYADLFGASQGSAKDPTSKNYQNRGALWQQMTVLATGYDQLGITVPAENALLKRALRTAFGDRPQTRARQEIRKQLKARENLMTTRPAGLPGRAPVMGDEAAMASIGQMLRDKGLPDDDADVTPADYEL